MSGVTIPERCYIMNSDTMNHMSSKFCVFEVDRLKLRPFLMEDRDSQNQSGHNNSHSQEKGSR